MAVPPPKTDLRRLLRRARRGHVEEMPAEGTASAAEAAVAHLMPYLAPGSHVAVHLAVGRELSTEPLIRALIAAGCGLGLPRLCPGSPEIVFASWMAGQPLAPGPHGIPQPHDDAAIIRTDVIVAPLVGFDRQGRRLGQGAGSYDRAFAALPHAWRIGWAWSVQEVDVLPCDGWDQPLHAVATEREWITCGARP